MEKFLIEEEIVCQAKSKKQSPIILTVKNICIYDKNKNTYNCIKLTDIKSWSYLVSLYKFEFKTSSARFVTEPITNDDEVYNALNEIMPEKCRNLSEDVEEDVDMVVAYEYSPEELQLNKNENIVCQATMKDSFLDSKSGFIITTERIFVYNKKQRAYANFYFEDVICWKSVEESIEELIDGYTLEIALAFETSKGNYETGVLCNGKEILKVLNKTIPEKCQLSETDDSLIIECGRIFIYDEEQETYISFVFEDVVYWEENESELYETTFVFKTAEGIYTAENIIYPFDISCALENIMPEKKHAAGQEDILLEKEPNLDAQSKDGFGSSDASTLSSIILAKTGPEKYEVMRIIKSYTLEDIAKISEKLNNLPCVILENCDEMKAEIVMRELTGLGAEVYKK